MNASFLHVLRGIDDYRSYQREQAAELAAQRAFEDALCRGRKEFIFQGFCVACEKVMPLRVDLDWGNGVTPNWRERLQCSCGLNNRIRAAVDFLGDIVPGKQEPRIYATEQVTAFFAQLRRRFRTAVGSEFLRDGTRPGMANAAGLRHEDLTGLTFPTGSLDAVLSFDVLEHVPDYRRALREMARVLAPGGRLLASFPFHVDSPDTVVRATVDCNGTLTHHLPPEYHGDPVSDAGCLCFQVFGWSVLDEMRSAGFADATTSFYWSADRGYLGRNQLMIVARR